MTLTLSERVRIAGLNASVARASFDIWWTYASDHSRPDHLEAMNEYSEHFRFDEHAHFVALIVGLSSLFDPTENTITIRRIVTKAVADGHQTLKPLIATVDALQSDPRVLGVLHLRNKLFAHRDVKVSYAAAFEGAKITADDLRKLLETAFQIIGKVADTVGARRPIHNTIATEHTVKMLRRLKPEQED